jgi:glycosyltransferase involved in cell wall biosynthesis
MRNLRLLQVVTNLSHGGAQLCAVELCIGLARRGFDVHLAYSSRGEQGNLDGTLLLPRLRDAQITCHDIPVMRRRISPLHDLLALRSLRRLIRTLRPDIVNTRMSKAGVLGRCAAALEKVPCIVHVADGWSFSIQTSAPMHGLFLLLERFCARISHCLVTVSPALIDEGLRRGIKAPHYAVVRHGIDTQAYRRETADPLRVREELRIPPGARVVGTIMTLGEQKAPFDLLTLAANVVGRLPDVRFLIVGDGPLRDSFQLALERERLTEKVHLAGMRSDVPRMLRAMDVFVLTSRWEGLPRVLVEAMASGVPVVTTRVGAISDLVIHGETGLLAAPGNVSELTEHVLNLLNQPALGRRLAAAASQEKRLQPFDSVAAIEQYESLYRELLNLTNAGNRYPIAIGHDCPRL